MAKKAVQYIAIDNSEGAVIEVGKYLDVREAIEEYANDRDMDQGDVETYIQVFVLGEERDITAAPKGIEIVF